MNWQDEKRFGELYFARKALIFLQNRITASFCILLNIFYVVRPLKKSNGLFSQSLNMLRRIPKTKIIFVTFVSSFSYIYYMTFVMCFSGGFDSQESIIIRYK